MSTFSSSGPGKGPGRSGTGSCQSCRSLADRRCIYRYGQAQERPVRPGPGGRISPDEGRVALTRPEPTGRASQRGAAPPGTAALRARPARIALGLCGCGGQKQPTVKQRNGLRRRRRRRPHHHAGTAPGPVPATRHVPSAPATMTCDAMPAKMPCSTTPTVSLSARAAAATSGMGASKKRSTM